MSCSFVTADVMSGFGYLGTGYTHLKTRQKWRKPTLNLIALYSLITCFAILKFLYPLVGHYLTLFL